MAQSNLGSAGARLGSLAEDPPNLPKGAPNHLEFSRPIQKNSIESHRVLIQNPHTWLESPHPAPLLSALSELVWGFWLIKGAPSHRLGKNSKGKSALFTIANIEEYRRTFVLVSLNPPPPLKTPRRATGKAPARSWTSRAPHEAAPGRTPPMHRGSPRGPGEVGALSLQVSEPRVENTGGRERGCGGGEGRGGGDFLGLPCPTPKGVQIVALTKPQWLSKPWTLGPKIRDPFLVWFKGGPKDLGNTKCLCPLSTPPNSWWVDFGVVCRVPAGQWGEIFGFLPFTLL